MGVYRLTVEIHSPYIGGVGTNTWHARTIGTFEGFPGQLQAHLATLQDFYSAIGSLYPANTIVSTDGVWQSVEDPPDDSQQTTGFSQTQSGGGDPLPPQECLVVGWRTSSPGRSGRGRTFIGPLAVGTLEDNGTPDETARSLLSDQAAALIAVADGPTDGQFVVWSETDGVGRDFTSAAVRNVFGSLRSRRD